MENENSLRFLGPPAFLKHVETASKELVEALKIPTWAEYHGSILKLSALKLVVAKYTNGSAKLCVTLERPGEDPSWPTVEIDLLG